MHQSTNIKLKVFIWLACIHKWVTYCRAVGCCQMHASVLSVVIRIMFECMVGYTVLVLCFVQLSLWVRWGSHQRSKKCIYQRANLQRICGHQTTKTGYSHWRNREGDRNITWWKEEHFDLPLWIFIRTWAQFVSIPLYRNLQSVCLLNNMNTPEHFCPWRSWIHAL